MSNIRASSPSSENLYLNASAVGTSLQVLEMEVAGRDGQVLELGRLQQERDAFQAQLASAAAAAAASKMELEAANAAAAASKIGLETVRKDLEAATSIRSAQQQELEAVRANNAALAAELSSLRSNQTATASVLEERCASLASDVARAREQLSATEAAAATARAELASLRSDLDGRSADLQLARSRRDQLAQEAGAMRADLDAARADLDAARADLDAACADLASAREEKARLVQEMAAAASRIESLEAVSCPMHAPRRMKWYPRIVLHPCTRSNSRLPTSRPVLDWVVMQELVATGAAAGEVSSELRLQVSDLEVELLQLRSQLATREKHVKVREIRGLLATEHLFLIRHGLVCLSLGASHLLTTPLGRRSWQTPSVRRSGLSTSRSAEPLTSLRQGMRRPSRSVLQSPGRSRRSAAPRYGTRALLHVCIAQQKADVRDGNLVHRLPVQDALHRREGEVSTLESRIREILSDHDREVSGLQQLLTMRSSELAAARTDVEQATEMVRLQ